MSEWQPIEAAPKDGSRVLLIDDLDRFPYVGRWAAGLGDNGLWVEDYNSLPNEQPTHWLPIPVLAPIRIKSGRDAF